MTPGDALTVADQLADPRACLPDGKPWWRQSLAHGAPGIALLHIELAAAGARSWRRVTDWLAMISSEPITAGPGSGPLYGAPAIAYVLGSVAAARPGAYRCALTALDAQVAADTRRRLADAHTRLAARQLPPLAEFDTIRGLAGIGAHLLGREPGGQLLHEVLAYLVRLTTPLTRPGPRLPGWWTAIAPTGRPDPDNYPGGHGNAGMAHGIGGPLALLALATLHDVHVPGQTDAIEGICDWLDTWSIDTAHGRRWPYLVTHAEQTAGLPAEQSTEHRPGAPCGPAAVPVSHSGALRRPSWCYGTAGIARVQQLVGLATGNTARRRRAEHALLGALTDPSQRDRTVDATLCHGYTGLAQIASRAVADATDPTGLRALVPGLLASADAATLDGTGLLEGKAGAALASFRDDRGNTASTRWDRCLLIA